MSASIMCAWRWFEQLTTMKEQIFRKTIKLADVNKIEDHHKSQALLWNFSDLLLIMSCIQLDLIYLCNMRYVFKNDLNPSFLQSIIMSGTWGVALVYMELFIGQYVQRSCLYLKHMSPLTCSTIGYGMLLTMYCFCIAAVSRLADSYMFLFRSFGSELPWMMCPEGASTETCIDRAVFMKCYLENKQKDCYPNIKPELLSSAIFYKARNSLSGNAVLLLCAWLTIYVAMKRNLSDTRIMIKRLLLLVLVLFLCLLAPLLNYVGLGLSVAPLFSLRHTALLRLEVILAFTFKIQVIILAPVLQTWTISFKDFLRDHAIVRGGYQLIGSHVKPGPTAVNLTICSCALTYVITIFCQIFSTGILGVFMFYLKIINVDEALYFPGYDKLFNFYPFAFGMLAVRQAWSLVYFLLILLSSISYTVVGIAVLEESIYDDFPVMVPYHSYIRVILCILGFLIGVTENLLTSSSSYEDDLTLQFGHRLTIVLVFVFTFSVGYVYGTQRFSDDIHFLNRSQPATFWKICWKSCPFGILILIGKEIITIKFPLENVTEMASSIAYVLVLAMAVFRLLHLIVMSIKARNVTGMLLQAMPEWGPPDQEERRMRNTYNPREETRYWRKNNFCTHHCLINNELIMTIVSQEVAARVRSQDKDMSDNDFSQVMAQSKQNQAIFAIDKVSSTQLEAFEEEVEQKIKFLEKTREIDAKLRSQSISPKNHIKAIKSTDALDQRIAEIVRQGEQKAQLENRNVKKTEQKTSSRTRHRRLPTFVPKDTPRPRKQVLKTKLPVERKIIGEKRPTNIHTYAVQIPDFNLNPLKRAHLQSEFLKSTAKFEVVKMFEEPNRNTAPVLDKLHVRTPILSTLAGPSKSTSTSLSQRQFSGEGPKPVESHFPSKMPLNTSLLSVPSSELVSSATSSSVVSRKASSSCGQIQEIRVPRKTNMTSQALSVKIPSTSGSFESSLACSELHLLSHDLVLRDIIHSVHPQLISNDVTAACHETS